MTIATAGEVSMNARIMTLQDQRTAQDCPAKKVRVLPTARLTAFFLGLMATFTAYLADVRAYSTERRNLVRRDADEADLNIGAALTIAGIIIGAVVGVQVIAALAGTWFTAIGDLSNTFDTADVNDTTANSLLPIFRLLVALGGVFAIVGAALLAVNLTRRGD